MILQIFNSFGCFDINHWMFWVGIPNQIRKSQKKISKNTFRFVFDENREKPFDFQIRILFSIYSNISIFQLEKNLFDWSEMKAK